MAMIHLKEGGTFYGTVKDYDWKGKFLVVELHEEEINSMMPLDYKDWTTIKEGVVENSEAPNYKSAVRLEQNKSLFRIIVAGCYPHGYTTEAAAMERYEWLTAVV